MIHIRAVNTLGLFTAPTIPLYAYSHSLSTRPQEVRKLASDIDRVKEKLEGKLKELASRYEVENKCVICQFCVYSSAHGNVTLLGASARADEITWLLPCCTHLPGYVQAGGGD